MHAVTQIHVPLPHRVVQGCKCDRCACNHLLVDSSETCRYKAQLLGCYLLCHLAKPRLPCLVRRLLRLCCCYLLLTRGWSPYSLYKCTIADTSSPVCTPRIRAFWSALMTLPADLYQYSRLKYPHYSVSTILPYTSLDIPSSIIKWFWIPCGVSVEIVSLFTYRVPLCVTKSKS